MNIKIRYSAVDGYGELRAFKSLAGAKRYAVRRVGEHPEIGSYYAVSGDGVGKIEVYGGDASLADLFPPEPDPYAAEQAAYEAHMAEEARLDREDAEREAAFWREEAKKYEPYRAPGCKCSDHQLIHVGCDCGNLPF